MDSLGKQKYSNIWKYDDFSRHKRKDMAVVEMTPQSVRWESGLSESRGWNNSLYCVYLGWRTGGGTELRHGISSSHNMEEKRRQGGEVLVRFIRLIPTASSAMKTRTPQNTFQDTTSSQIDKFNDIYKSESKKYGLLFCCRQTSPSFRQHWRLLF